MVTTKITSVLLLGFLSSMTAVSVWKIVTKNIERESTKTFLENGTAEDNDDSDIFKPFEEDDDGEETLFPENKEDPYGYRLPGEVTPISYRIRIVPILDQKAFPVNGEVSIVTRAEKATNVITMHSKGLIINRHKVVTSNGSSDIEIVSTLKFDNLREFLVLNLKENMTIGNIYKISVEYRGLPEDGPFGLRRVLYEDSDGSFKRMVYSVFQSGFARYAFPCFDEPHLKAKFTISIARKEDMSSLSNMDLSGPPESDPKLPESYVWDNYRETPRMSTYLVAFIVSKFKSKKAEGRELRIWARESILDQTDYSLDLCSKLLDAIGNYTNIEYELSKMDLIAIPDFKGGAMENWGLVEFRESALLYKEGVSSQSDRKLTAITIAHEIAHQWFGNLVTPVWWKYLWLSEGFATYFMFSATEMIEPKWRIEDQFVVERLQPTFLVDCLYSSHPLVVNMTSTSTVMTRFDEITYQKGGSIVRMMEHFLTRNTFREGLRAYLSARAHDSADEGQLFEILDVQAKSDGVLSNNVHVKEIMKSWTNQAGHPILNVQRNYEDGLIIVTQEKFILDRNKKQDEATWWIPITYTTQETPDFANTSPSQWMSENNKSLTLNERFPSDMWVIFNIQESGFYRVNYDEENWKLITEYLNKKDFYKIHPVNRAQLIDDSFNLAKSGYLNYSLALDLTNYLFQETDYIPWYSAFQVFDFLDNRLISSSEYNKLMRHILHLIKKQYETVNFEESFDDDHLKHLSRSKVIQWACKCKHDSCIKTAKHMFSKWIRTKNNTIPVDLRSAVYCTGISEGGDEEWNFLWNEVVSTTVSTERPLILGALGCSRNKTTLRSYLYQTLDISLNLRNVDRGNIFKSVLDTPEGLDIALDFIIDNTWSVHSKFPLGIVYVNLAKRIASEAQANRAKDFIGVVIGTSFGGVVRREIQTIDINMAWREKYVPTIESWLKRMYK